MKRELGIGAVLLLVGGTGVFAQGNRPTAAPAGKAPAGASPSSNAPGNAPAASTPGATGTATTTTAAKTVAVRVPSGGDYSAYIQEAQGAAPRTVVDKADLEVPSLPRYTIYVLDMKSGYAARKAVDAKSAPAEISFAAPDFNLVQKVRVLATGKEGKPIAKGTVTLTDSGNNTTRGIIQPASQGVAEFSFVKNGTGTIAVSAGEGAENTTVQKSVSIDLPKNETVQSVTLELPSVTAVVEPAPGSATATTNTPAAAPAATNTPAAAPQAVAPAPAPATAPVAAPVQPTPMERTQPSLTESLGNFVIGLIQFAILIALLVFGYRYAKKQGITVETVLQKMGVQPETVGAGGASLAGANLAGSVAAPGPAPAPPPVVADPNQCAFCGQMKDPSGGCACTVTRGAGASPAMGNGFGGGLAATGTGPRLVAMGGTYLGQVFPIQGAAVIGRDATNPIPLDRDTTASRRHAQITDQGGIYRIQDLGSSNGTYVNGAKITETQLSPGDEVAIGGTRFRFEV